MHRAQAAPSVNGDPRPLVFGLAAGAALLSESRSRFPRVSSPTHPEGLAELSVWSGDFRCIPGRIPCSVPRTRLKRAVPRSLAGLLEICFNGAERELSSLVA